MSTDSFADKTSRAAISSLAYLSIWWTLISVVLLALAFIITVNLRRGQFYTVERRTTSCSQVTSASGVSRVATICPPIAACSYWRTSTAAMNSHLARTLKNMKNLVYFRSFLISSFLHLCRYLGVWILGSKAIAAARTSTTKTIRWRRHMKSITSYWVVAIVG